MKLKKAIGIWKDRSKVTVEKQPLTENKRLAREDFAWLEEERDFFFRIF